MAFHPVRSWMEVGPFTPADLEVVHNHWLGFPPHSPTVHYVLAAAYTVIMTLGVFGNLLVLYMFCRCRSLRSPANILIANLAISDFFLLAKMPVFIYNSMYFGPILGQIGNDVYGFLGGLTGAVSIANLAAIALDRYHVIVQPLDPGRRISRLRARLCVLVTWVYGGVLASCPLLGLSRYTPEGLLTSSSFDYLNSDWRNRTFIVCFFFAAWVVPFCIITLSYFGIYRIVERATQRGQAGEISDTSRTRRHCREHDKRRTEVRLAWVAAVVVGLWFISWTPYAVVALLAVSGRPPDPLVSMLPALFCKTASCLDPYVYAVTHPRFRRELAKLCTRACGRLGIGLGRASRRPAKARQGRGRFWRRNASLTSTATVTTARRGSLSSEECVEEEDVPVMMVDFRRGARGRDPRESVCSTSSLRESVQDSPPPVGPLRSAGTRADESRSSSSGEPPPQAARVLANPVLPPPHPPPAMPAMPAAAPQQLQPLSMGDCPSCPQIAHFPLSASDQQRYRAPSIFTSPKPRRSKSFSQRANKLSVGEPVLPTVLQDPISV
ncbi:opsin, ultraviolet-sensitive-like isoform X2 [Frankliniella occidentalis]|uniref:Opsin, ultraviolet-sensitive-like isoform X2 n=1 Tax=Frankliniella occidentalis TaxID=133901 RepID=A0A9C6XSI7_FRAOC|nr:opsin, ultraviolet-sensitive-like isoform X2 [Frankliniella occidentalis]